MHIIYFKRMILCLLAAVLTGCAAVPARPETVPAATAAAETVAAESGPRYQVAWAADAVIYEVNVRQYTREGTFAAFSKHLPVLKDMGINTLWFMPIHPISQTLLLHGQADQLLDMEDIPVTLDGAVTLQPWEFRIAADKG